MKPEGVGKVIAFWWRSRFFMMWIIIQNFVPPADNSHAVLFICQAAALLSADV